MHHPIEWIAHTTAFVTPVVEHWPEYSLFLLWWIVVELFLILAIAQEQVTKYSNTKS